MIYWAKVRARVGGLVVSECFYFQSAFWRDDFRTTVRNAKLGELDGFGEFEPTTLKQAVQQWTDALK